jgi:hypothetical protein
VREWKQDEPLFGLMGAAALAGLARLVGLDPGAASILPRRLAVDGLLLVWQGSPSARSDR